MADSGGWEKLGYLLGGGAGNVREEAYQEGRLRTAQTENALAQARENQLDAIASEKKQKARDQTENVAIEAGFSGPEAKLLGNLAVGESGSDFKSGVEGMLGKQELGFRETLGNPESSLGEQFAAGQGVQGKVLNPFDMTGAGDAVDLRNLPAPGQDPDFITTPLGQSMILENEQSAAASGELAALRGRTPRLGTSTGLDENGNPLPKPPSGFVANPNYNPDLPMGPGNELWTAQGTGGPHDPNTPGKLGSRERQVVLRVIGAARNTTSDLQNIMALPAGASLGVYGTGMGGNPGSRILDATVDHLKNTVADSEIRQYNAMLGGFSNALSTIERQGLAGSDTMTAQYDTLLLRPEDTVYDKMLKLALVRQAVENGLEPHLYTNVLPPDLKAYVGNLISSVKKAVPYSPHDVILLNAEQVGSSRTIADIMNEAGADIPIGKDGLPERVEVATPGERPATANADIGGGVTKIPAKIPQGFRYTDPDDGKIYEYGGPEGGDGTNADDWFPVAQ